VVRCGFENDFVQKKHPRRLRSAGVFMKRFSTGLCPSGENGVGLHYLIGCAGEVVGEFTGVAGDFDFDGIKAVFFKTHAELLGVFVNAVLAEAINHGAASVRTYRIAM
jgi:hypothetical protein